MFTGALNCSRDILNGWISSDCSLKPGSYCSFACKSGYFTPLVEPLRCLGLPNQEWSHPTNEICLCEFLIEWYFIAFTWSERKYHTTTGMTSYSKCIYVDAQMGCCMTNAEMQRENKKISLWYIFNVSMTGSVSWLIQHTLAT